MKLTRLRLIGFKSFVEPTDFEIEPGLTGVVGPNGCGKSNLVEAMRWVMGEASYKAMRAAEMDDVIFSGNTGRPARNHAEVAISLDNTDRKAPAAFNDQDALEISRRIMREQGSTFRVNGREVRARDVAMVFADASTGSRSPALVHQGRIGEIIQARPDQRRRVLEEAAGISGLHARRHEAELRLKAAEQNLARAEDVISQLAAQVAALKTQARQAVRYRNISGQVRRTEALLLHLRWLAAASRSRRRANGPRTKPCASSPSAPASRRVARRGKPKSQPGCRPCATRKPARPRRCSGSSSPATRLEREETRARERIVELDRRLEQFAADLGRERGWRPTPSRAGTARRRGTALRRRSAGERRAAYRRQRPRRRGGCRARGIGKILREATGALADLTARRNQLQTALPNTSSAPRAFGGAGQYRRRPRRNRERRARRARRSASPLAAAQTALAEAESAARAAEAAHRQRARSASRRRARRSPKPNAACSGWKPKPRPSASSWRSRARIFGRRSWTRSRWRKATRRRWAPRWATISTRRSSQSAPMRWAGAALDPSDPVAAGRRAELSRYVKAPQELARRLAQIGVVERADGPRLAAMLKPGQRLVSREGDLWRWDGFAAAAHAPTGAARRLAERGRMQAIEGELADRARGSRGQAAAGRGRQGSPGCRGNRRDRSPRALRARRSARPTPRAKNMPPRNARSAAMRRAFRRCRRPGSGRAPAATRQWRPTARRRRRLPALPAARRSRRAARRRQRNDRRATGARSPRSASRRRRIAREAELANRRLQAIAASGAPGTNARTQRRGPDRHHRRADRGGEPRARRTRQRAGEIRQSASGADRRDRDGDRRPPRRRRPAGGGRNRARRGRQSRARRARSGRRSPRRSGPHRGTLRRRQAPARRYRA